MSFNTIAADHLQRRSSRRFLRAVQFVLLTSVFTSSYTAHVYAADITFKVFVNIQGLKNLFDGDVNVLCATLDANNNYLSAPNSGLPIKLNATGDFSGPASVEIDFSNPNDFFKAKTYECSLAGHKLGVTRAIVIGDGSEWHHAKSGNLKVTGPIP